MGPRTHDSPESSVSTESKGYSYGVMFSASRVKTACTIRLARFAACRFRLTNALTLINLSLPIFKLTRRYNYPDS